MLGRLRCRKLRFSPLEKGLESRLVISDQEKCWPQKGRREQAGWKVELGKPAKGEKE